MATRDQRRSQLEALSRNPKQNISELMALYIQSTGKGPDMGTFIVQDWIPKILDAEFPPRDDVLPQKTPGT